MKSPACVLTIAVTTLLCAERASHAEPPHTGLPPAAHVMRDPDGAIRQVSHGAPRPLSNEELFRLLFEEQAGTTTAAAWQDEAAPPAPMEALPEPGMEPFPPAPGYGAAPCGAPGCASCCNECPPFWQHRSGIFGEFLYLHARDADVHIATPTDGLGVNAVPIDNAVIADPAYDPGFRIGGSFAVSETASFGIAYTWYESSVNDLATLPGGTGFLFPELLHPNTINVMAADYLAAESDYDIEFQFFDATGSFLLHGDCKTRINGIAGFRLANLEQDLLARYSILGVQTVDSRIDFNGFGPRLGLEAERLVGRGCFVYGNAFANFLAGQFEAELVQEAVFAPGFPEVNTGFEDDRIVSLLELELGVGWQSRCRRVSVRAGYYIAGWFNTVTTREFIEAAQVFDFDDPADTLSFDGLTTRIEYNY